MRITWVIDPSNTAQVPVVPSTTPTQGQGASHPSGLTVEGCGCLYFLNKSNVIVYLVFEDGTTSELPAWWARPYYPKTKTGQIWLSTAMSLNTINQPISQLTLETFQPGEDTRALYSGPIPYQQSQGNALVVASSVAQYGQPPGTSTVLSSPQAQGALSPTFPVQLNSDGSYNLGNQGNIVPAPRTTHDGQGNVTMKTLTTGTGITTAGVPVLSTTNQEHGRVGINQSNGVAGNALRVTKNFKTDMTNVPSSITITVISSLNAGTPGADSIDKYGFRMSETIVANGASGVDCSYDTVGN